MKYGKYLTYDPKEVEKRSDKWKDEWASQLTPAERENLRSWGIEVPDAPKPPEPPAPRELSKEELEQQHLQEKFEKMHHIEEQQQSIGYDQLYGATTIIPGLGCTDHSHAAACTESPEPRGLCGRRARRALND